MRLIQLIVRSGYVAVPSLRPNTAKTKKRYTLESLEKLRHLQYSMGIDRNNSPDSLFFEYTVNYCLAEKYDHPCRLGMSPPILITALMCNLCKTVCFLLVLSIVGPGFPLVTNGDVVESLLLRPDPELQGRCLASKITVEKEKRFWFAQYLPLQWRSKRKRWAAGALKGFWLGTLSRMYDEFLSSFSFG